MSVDEIAHLYAYPEAGLVRANMVSSLDGAVTADGRSKPISGPADMFMFGVLRALADVIVVGAGTARTEGYGPGRARDEFAHLRKQSGQAPAPTIAIITRSAHLDPEAAIFTKALTPTIVITCESAPEERRAHLAQVADVHICGDESVDLPVAMDVLRERGMPRVLCEGGPSLLGDLSRPTVWLMSWPSPCRQLSREVTRDGFSPRSKPCSSRCAREPYWSKTASCSASTSAENVHDLAHLTSDLPHAGQGSTGDTRPRLGTWRACTLNRSGMAFDASSSKTATTSNCPDDRNPSPATSQRWWRQPHARSYRNGSFSTESWSSQPATGWTSTHFNCASTRRSHASTCCRRRFQHRMLRLTYWRSATSH